MGIEANLFYMGKWPPVLQQAAKAPACLESNTMLATGGHRHKQEMLLLGK